MWISTAKTLKPWACACCSASSVAAWSTPPDRPAQRLTLVASPSLPRRARNQRGGLTTANLLYRAPQQIHTLEEHIHGTPIHDPLPLRNLSR